METAYQIFNYLPLKYKNPTDAEYFDFLVQSVEQNYEAQNYHFAIVALHMIYMGIVYQYTYGIFRADPKRFEYVLIGFHDHLQIRDINELSWHSFSNENESTIFQFYLAVGIPKDEIGKLKAPVKQRNDILHANGTFITNEEEFEGQSQTYLSNLEKIHKYCAKEYEKLFFQFLDQIKIEIFDENEALQYIEDDFIPEFNINSVIINTFSKIAKERYLMEKQVFYSAIRRLTEIDEL